MISIVAAVINTPATVGVSPFPHPNSGCVSLFPHPHQNLLKLVFLIIAIWLG